MEVSKIAYKYSFDSNNIQCDIKFSVDAKVGRRTIAVLLQPHSMSVVIKTPFTNIENIGVNAIVVLTDKNNYFGRIQAKPNPDRGTIVNCTIH